MKTSFYFLLWIVIYEVIDLLPIGDAGGQLSFLIALGAVFAISVGLAKAMPHTLAYCRMLNTATLLEETYTGNVEAYTRRLRRMSVVETVTAAYFVVTIIALLAVIFTVKQYDIFALIIFAFLAFGAVGQSARLIKAYRSLRANPTGDQCARITTFTFRLPYEQYYHQHEGRTFAEMLPPRPRHYGVFLTFSIIVAIATALCGLAMVVVNGIPLAMASSANFALIATAVMYLMYGVLALYFGIRDTISCIMELRMSRRLAL